ncbi:MAG: hypothetical protein IKK82_15175 [Kiritimatiellae bacterium]|nr:hypothetical protein [Kiritimatiellia bacterium]
MKNKIVLLMVLPTVVMSVFAHKKDPEYLKARRNGGDLRMIVSAVDDRGNAVTNASVKVLMGMNFREKAYYVTGLTDTNGQFIVEGKTTGNEVEIEIMKGGYYRGHDKLCLIAMGKEFEVTNGRWQPWGMEVNIPMRLVINPVSLVKKKGGVAVPESDAWIGFDMKRGDWVGYGCKGEVPDFEVKLQWDGKPVVSSDFAILELRFVGDGAGFYMDSTTSCSDFSGVYNASTNEVYRKEFICSTTRRNGKIIMQEIPQGKLFVTRSRCRIDDKGVVVQANYGFVRAIMIEGGYNGKAEMFVNYRFNPTPNDTNLEPK